MASVLQLSQTIPTGQGGRGAPIGRTPALGIAGTRGLVPLRTSSWELRGLDHLSADHYGGQVPALQGRRRQAIAQRGRCSIRSDTWGKAT